MKRTDHALISTSIRTLADLVVFRPRSLEDAVRVACEAGAAPTIVAGGTDIVAQCNEGLSPRALLALSAVRELQNIAVRGDSLSIGSLVTHDAGSNSETVRRSLPGFASAWDLIANVRIRFSATLGGNVMARRRYEMPLLLSALGARLRFADASGEVERDVANPAEPLVSPRAILTAAVIPLAGAIAFDYDRSLRPIVTHAVALRRSAAGTICGRVVIGTEALPLYAYDFALDGGDRTALRDKAPDIARETYRAFPLDVPATTRTAYLRRVGPVVLARQLVRLADDAA